MIAVPPHMKAMRRDREHSFELVDDHDAFDQAVLLRIAVAASRKRLAAIKKQIRIIVVVRMFNDGSQTFSLEASSNRSIGIRDDIREIRHSVFQALPGDRAKALVVALSLAVPREEIFAHYDIIFDQIHVFSTGPVSLQIRFHDVECVSIIAVRLPVLDPQRQVTEVLKYSIGFSFHRLRTNNVMVVDADPYF